MAKEESTRWRCANRDCDWSMVATATEGREDAPRCVCGGEMKRAEPVPVLSYLEFLREDIAIADEAKTDGK